MIEMTLDKLEKNSLNSLESQKNYSHGMTGERQWIIDWLESEQGENWSRDYHQKPFSMGLLTARTDNGGDVTDVLWYG